jgi:hypothetical protein
MKKILFIALLLAMPVVTHADGADPAIPTASSTSATTLEAAPVALTLSGTSYDGSSLTFAATTTPANGMLGTISGNSVTYTPNANFIGTDSFEYIAIEGATSSVPATVTIAVTAPPTPDTATFTIRDGAAAIGPVTVDLPPVGAPDVSLTATGSSTPHAVSARSALALLSSLAAGTSTFAITNLDYSYAYDSYLVNCIAVPAAEAPPDCYSWTYAVDGSFPSVGMDKDVLQNGDTAYIIFGSQWQISTDKSNVSTGESFTVTAQEYDPSTGMYAPASGIVVGAAQFDANYNPTEFATSTTDANGHATLSLANAGTYDVGVQETGYFPNTSVTVSTPAQSSGGNGGGGGILHSQFNVSNALAYLASKQNADGSFGSNDSPIITDWTAIAFAASNPGAAKTKLKNYLTTAEPAMSSVTDYERHAMALEALGINPYSGTPVNYIAPIVAAFDGTQIGDPTLDNDDIFSIIPLTQAGYSSTDPTITQEIAYVMSKQRPDGSWDESPDMTAAAILAVGPFFAFPNYPQVMGAAAGYLASTEQANGSWGSGGATNIDSTSWVQTAINAIPVDPNHPLSWTSSAGFLPADAIAGAQQSDGGVRPVSDSVDNRVWSTSYAVVAGADKSWLTILQSFPLPSIPSNEGGGEIISTAASTAATSTATTATNTPAVATSTPEISATSTPPIVTIAATTTATTAIMHIHAGTRKLAAKKTSALETSSTPAPIIQPAPENQTAAAAGAAPGGFFGNLWHAITSFFASIF